MATGRLPEREQRILDEMEAALDRDHRLNRRLRAVRISFRVHSAWAASGAARGFFMAMAALASLILLVVGISTSNPGVIWAFAATWTFALLGGRRAMHHRAERRDRA
ncbi:hypothetical protein GCM10018793_52120 [Streptomyces sulfonofaciens]|uniref:DUF3040 domain-containing protein n=1 Tax=Streptomyces sulfonofaciens TaxID=68272 RepID=A0A919GJI9_9ACTN|nr:DUF3040 domain-containing protein [Streptomyces sulfonofaciens]GHH85170.1 hypothetical protein GCM10018793_52120 [Streptomyces sulfonofaciens]